jgi:anaerobic magnesium-protoporphyrin IX monomethyl ester cyclase
LKVLFISPSPHLNKIHAHGVRIMSACLKGIGCEVETVFLPRRLGEVYSDRTLSQIGGLAERADLVGISLMTDDFENAVRITGYLKGRVPAPVLWGGIHAAIEPDACLEHADMVCVGEGEDAIVELASRMRLGEDYGGVAGIWQRCGSSVAKNPLRPLISDLDRLPYPDYDCGSHYVLHEGEIQPLSGPLVRTCLQEYYLTLTSRGCPYRCTYCWNHGYAKLFPGHHQVRKRSVGNVIGELRGIVQAFPFTEMICIDDDAFFMRSEQEIEEFSSRYREEVRIPLWVTGASPSTVSRGKLDLLAGAGLTALRMGIQSASPRTRKLYRRPETSAAALNAIRLIESYPEQIKRRQFDVILDNPWETDADLRMTLRFLSRLRAPFELIIFPLQFYPATDLYERAKREGLLAEAGAERERLRHHRHRHSFLNQLFFLLDECGRSGMGIRPAEMAVLTNPLLMRLGISGWWAARIRKRLEAARRAAPAAGGPRADFGQAAYAEQLGAGWFDWEQGAGGGFRWMSREATVYLFPSGGERLLDLRGAAPAIKRYGPKGLTLKVYEEGRLIFKGPLAEGDIALTAPLRSRAEERGARLKFRLALSGTFSPAETGEGQDIRDLGIVIRSIGLKA